MELIAYNITEYRMRSKRDTTFSLEEPTGMIYHIEIMSMTKSRQLAVNAMTLSSLSME